MIHSVVSIGNKFYNCIKRDKIDRSGINLDRASCHRNKNRNFNRFFSVRNDEYEANQLGRAYAEARVAALTLGICEGRQIVGKSVSFGAAGTLITTFY